MLKPTEYRQHILIPEPVSSPAPPPPQSELCFTCLVVGPQGGGGECTGLIPRVAFISDKGKKVLPFLNQRTQGKGVREELRP